jgi:predicted MFS family arabinose efflux permease
VGVGVVAALICGINLVWAWFKLPESLPAEKRGKVEFHRFASTRDAIQTLRHPTLGPLIVLLFLVTFAFANVEVSFSLFAKTVLGMNIEHIYGMFVFIGLVMAFTQGVLIRRVLKHIAEPNLIVVGGALLVVGLALLPIWTSLGMILIGMTIMSVGQGLCQPSVLSMISRGSSATRQGNVFGTSQAASSLARIVGPLFGGLLFDWNHSAPFWGAAALMALACVWAWEVRGRLLRRGIDAEAGEAGDAAGAMPEA